MSDLEIALDAIEEFRVKLVAVGDLSRLNSRQRRALAEAANIILTLPRKFLDGGPSMPTDGSTLEQRLARKEAVG